jgi:hypothetical protein
VLLAEDTESKCLENMSLCIMGACLVCKKERLVNYISKFEDTEKEECVLCERIIPKDAMAYYYNGKHEPWSAICKIFCFTRYLKIRSDYQKQNSDQCVKFDRCVKYGLEIGHCVYNTKCVACDIYKIRKNNLLEVRLCYRQIILKTSSSTFMQNIIESDMFP